MIKDLNEKIEDGLDWFFGLTIHPVCDLIWHCTINVMPKYSGFFAVGFLVLCLSAIGYGVYIGVQ